MHRSRRTRGLPGWSRPRPRRSRWRGGRHGARETRCGKDPLRIRQIERIGSSPIAQWASAAHGSLVAISMPALSGAMAEGRSAGAPSRTPQRRRLQGPWLATLDSHSILPAAGWLPVVGSLARRTRRPSAASQWLIALRIPLRRPHDVRAPDNLDLCPVPRSPASSHDPVSNGGVRFG